MPYVWLWLLTAQLLLLLPNCWKESLHCREGSMLSAHANACVMCVFRLFPRLFFRPFKSYTIFTAEICFCYHTVNDSSSVPNHGIAATLAYVNLELTNTLVFLMSSRVRAGRGISITTAVVSVSVYSRFLPRWAGRGFWDKMQV